MANNSGSSAPSLTTDNQLQVGIGIEFVAPPDKVWNDENFGRVNHQYHRSLSEDACRYRLASAMHDADFLACYQIVTTWLVEASQQSPSQQSPSQQGPSQKRPPNNGVPYGCISPPPPGQQSDGPAALFDYCVVRSASELTDFRPYMLWVPCKFDTPILSEHDVTTTGLPKLRGMLEALHSADETQKPHINCTFCTLSVYLSPVIPEDCAVDYARRVLTLALLLDKPLLQPLCDTRRLPRLHPFPDSEILKNFVHREPYCSQRRRSAPLFSKAAKAHLPSTWASEEMEALQLIWREDAKLRDLQALLKHQLKANSEKLAPVLCKKKRTPSKSGLPTMTIEFRHAQASFSVQFVREWTRLVLAIGRVALLPAENYKKALEEIHSASRNGGEGKGRLNMEVMEALSAAAKQAGMEGDGPSSEYWRSRATWMSLGCNPDVSYHDKAVLDNAVDADLGEKASISRGGPNLAREAQGDRIPEPGLEIDESLPKDFAAELRKKFNVDAYKSMEKSLGRGFEAFKARLDRD